MGDLDPVSSLGSFVKLLSEKISQVYHGQISQIKPQDAY
jgi:hypothetical protein